MSGLGLVKAEVKADCFKDMQLTICTQYTICV